jgi:hypothetical protein
MMTGSHSQLSTVRRKYAAGSEVLKAWCWVVMSPAKLAGQLRCAALSVQRIGFNVFMVVLHMVCYVRFPLFYSRV